MISNVSKEYGKTLISENPKDLVIGLAGNPNTGKSTLFNYLTGLRQHTGNWPGKTVSNAKGYFDYKNSSYLLVDLPGTYSLFINSQEEEIARDFICFENPEMTIVVLDGTNIERNLNLALQVMEITDNVILCINLVDEAEKKGIHIDIEKLEEILQVPVVSTVARDGKGVDKLLEIIHKISEGQLNPRPKKVIYNKEIEEVISKIEKLLGPYLENKYNSRWVALRLLDGDLSMKEEIKKIISNNKNLEVLEQIEELTQSHKEVNYSIVSNIYEEAEKIAKKVVSIDKENNRHWDKKLDDILTNKVTGYPIMILLLGLIFWITIIGANYPSEFLAKILFKFEDTLSSFMYSLNPPDWLHGILILGVYRTLAWVVSVMLPPMAIFFPMFTLLEDLGYLPRIAFNLDHLFNKAGTQGKQALTMSMGFGCNAAGVIACRIIDSPREKLIAILTNNFVPCNGRFPLIIAISTIFIGSLFNVRYSSLIAALSVLAMVLIGVGVTLIISKFLSSTFLKGIPSTFTLELPPYRRPQVRKVIVRSIFDRTLFVLGKAVMVAIPAGAVAWIFANVTVGGTSILNICANFLNPFGKLLGLDGFIIMAFLLGLPANEIVLPILIMSYMSKGALLDLENIDALRALLLNNGWTFVTGLNFMLFSLLHFPCGTTLLTIKEETGSCKWSIFAFLLTSIVAILVTFLINLVVTILI
jgi:ferrous iron transport protein B